VSGENGIQETSFDGKAATALTFFNTEGLASECPQLPLSAGSTLAGGAATVAAV
jgi:hypothetical protein